VTKIVVHFRLRLDLGRIQLAPPGGLVLIRKDSKNREWPWRIRGIVMNAENRKEWLVRFRVQATGERTKGGNSG
jgi:hypothetical protein